MIEIHPIYNLQAILKAWGYIIEDMKALMEFCHEDTNPDVILNDIMSGNALLWLMFREKKYIAFMVTKMLIVPLGGKRLLVYSLYSKENLSKDDWAYGIAMLDKFARQHECTHIDFYTIRDRAFERKLKDTGWKVTYTVFSKEVNNAS